MHLSSSEVEKLRSIIRLCRQVNIEVVVLGDGKVLGANEARNLAIISETDLKLDEGVKLGIGRVSELDKRLSLFPEAEAPLKVNDRGEISIITFSSGKTKAQFRCSAMALLDRRYPKSNEDQPTVIIELNKSEMTQLVKGAKTFGASTVVVKVDRSGLVRLECTDSVNDQFTMDIEAAADFVDEAEPAVFTYNADNFCLLVDMASKELDTASLVVGEAGSLTTIVKGHALVITPGINEE